MTLQRAVNFGWKPEEDKMTQLRLKSRQWIVDEHDNIVMGEGRKEIFENIERTGSINKTAKIMKMSYKAVWGKIKASEKHVDFKIVHTDRKNGTHMTTEGKELLNKYRLLKEKCLLEEDRLFAGIFN
jgi:molybdate transport system regulatory protein